MYIFHYPSHPNSANTLRFILHHCSVVMAENSLESIPVYLKQSLIPQSAKAAEAQLRSLDQQPHFAINLLNVIASTSVEPPVRLAAALFLKNLIRRRWVNEDGEYITHSDDVQYIKSEILNIMVKLPNNLQVQVGESISIIAELDFPHRWENLIDDLVVKLSGDDFVLNKGILIVAHSIFKKWRPLFRSDELFLEIKMVLDKFAVPFMALLARTDQLIDAAISQNDKASLEIYMDCLLLEVQIYYDLNCQDIPEFFENNIKDGFAIMHKYLNLQTTLVGDADDDEEVDILIKTKTAIIQLVSLYVTRYAEEFDWLVQTFITSVWQLVSAEYISKQQKYDLLAVTALNFLSSITQVQKYKNLFDNQQAISEIIEKIILPNISFREADKEAFEDEPISYVRGDLEGSDFESRRKSATDFLRELKEVNTNLLTSTVMSYVDQFLLKDDWESKDKAIYLFSSLAAKGSVTNIGVTSTNMLVDVVQFFTKNIASYLVGDANPILKTDAIKFILTFRNQLTKEQLLTTIPLLIKHLQDSNPVVYTYAAITIDKLLSMTDLSSSAHAPVFDKQDIRSYVNDLLSNLFRLILSTSVPEKLSENEFLIKCIMHVLHTAEDSIDQQTSETMIKQLLEILSVIAKNPANPRFTHYVFESLGFLVKFFSGSANGVLSLIQLIVPSLLQILSEDVQEFVPYSFQLLSFLLESLPQNLPLPEQYVALIHPLMLPVVWEYRGNVPGVTRLLIAIMERDATSFAQGELAPLLGVFQKLIASRTNDSYGFDLLLSILLNFSQSALSSYLNQIAVLLLTRLKGSRTDKFIKKFVSFLMSLCCIPLNDRYKSRTDINADFTVKFIESVQTGVFRQIYNSFILPTTSTYANLQDKKVACIGLAQLVTSAGFVQGECSDLVAASVEQLCSNLSNIKGLTANSSSAVGNTISGDSSVASVAINELDLESAAYGSNFSKLVSILIKPFDPVPQVANEDSRAVSTTTVSTLMPLLSLGLSSQLSQGAQSVISEFQAQ